MTENQISGLPHEAHSTAVFAGIKRAEHGTLIGTPLKTRLLNIRVYIYALNFLVTNRLLNRDCE